MKIYAWPKLLQGVLPVDRRLVPNEIIAGITLAALAIPEVMGYTRIAGMPVVTGLYTILIPTAIFSLFCSSRHMVVGADSATAAIMAAGLATIAVSNSSEYIAYAGVLALMTAIFLILARLIRLGFLADFLSRTVLIGFLTGVGFQVAIGEISGLLDLPSSGAGVVQKIVSDFQQLEHTNYYSLAISIGVLLIIVGTRKINRRIPGSLIAILGAISISYVFNISEYGVTLLGSAPRGLPVLSLPGIALSMPILNQLLAISLSMFIVILAQSAATARAYAARYGEKLNENADLVALGLANIGAGLSGTFVVNGSPTKTQMVDSAGGRSQLAQLVTVAFVLLVLMFLTGPLEFMPKAVLSAVVFLIGIELIDIKGLAQIRIERPYEFWVAIITIAAVIFLGVEQGILLAILLSLLIHTRHGYKPRNSLLMTDPDGTLRVTTINKHTQVLPGLMIYRFHHSMYYANSDLFMRETDELINSADPPLNWFCLDAIAIDDIDFTAAESLRKLSRTVKEKGIRMVLANVDDEVYSELRRSGLFDLIGVDSIYKTTTDVIEGFEQRYPVKSEDPLLG